MQLANLPKRHAEVGRIRLGDKTDKNAPRKLTKFRLTSAHHDLLARVALIYGGTPVPWDGAPTGKGTQHELYIESDVLDVMVPSGQVLSQSYELWAGGGCQKRCNGMVRDTGEACDCPDDPDERLAAAQKGQACKLTTRLSLWLPKVPGIGVWRLESHGYYAAVELPGAAEILGAATDLGKPLPATLRIASRVVKRDGKTQQFVVPQLDLANTVADMFAIANGHEPPRQVEAQRPAAIEAPAVVALPAAKTDGMLLIEQVKTAGQWHADQIKAAKKGRAVSAKAFDEDPQWLAEVADILAMAEPEAVAPASTEPPAVGYAPGQEPF